MANAKEDHLESGRLWDDMPDKEADVQSAYVVAPEKHEAVAYEINKVLNNLGPYKVDRLALDEQKDKSFRLTLVSNDFDEVRMGNIASAVGDLMAGLGTVQVVAGLPKEFEEDKVSVQMFTQEEAKKAFGSKHPLLREPTDDHMEFGRLWADMEPQAEADKQRPYIIADEKLEPAANRFYKTLLEKTSYNIGRLSLEEAAKDSYKLTLVSKAFTKGSEKKALDNISTALGSQLSDLGKVEVITTNFKGYTPVMPKNHAKWGKRSFSTRRNFSSEPARL